MSGDVHVQFCESPGVRFPRATHLVVLIHGSRQDAEALKPEVAEVLRPMGLLLSPEKSKVCDMEEGFDFLGWRIQRRARRGQNNRKAVYTYPSKRSLISVTRKVRSLTRRHKHRTLAELLVSVNRVLRGWCNYFRHGVSSKTFSYVDHFTWWRIVNWLRKRHAGLSWKELRQRVLPNWQIAHNGVAMYRPGKLLIERYRYRGARIRTPWHSETNGVGASKA